MVDVKYLLLALWTWIVEHGLALATLVIIGVLIPRVGRLIVRIITERMNRGEEQTKSYLALVGALVYLLEMVAYFFLIYSALTNLGVPAVGAAVPATVVSAAIGFGAQKVIADFLAGFFIISEHQYGVGDVVAFDGTSEKVTGTVVRLTLRATQIRSGNGELITLPNSQASITINQSQEWSRAVVDLELPMTDDDSMSSLSATVSEVTQNAIDDADVREEILGEVSVLPAMSITPPTAAGLPWTVGIQVTVDVNPATQWKVQRIIRAALINEFWDRFQAPGAHRSRLTGSPTEPFPAIRSPHGQAPDADTPSLLTTSAARAALSSAATTAAMADAVEAGEPRPSEETKQFKETTGVKDSEDATDSLDAKDTLDYKNEETTSVSTTSFDAVASDVAKNGIWRNIDTNSRITRLLSLGGRIRPSSGVLIIVIIAISVVGILAATPQGRQPGLLSPSRWQPTTTAPATPSPEVPTQTYTPDTGEQLPYSDTPTTVPSAENNSPTTDQPGTGSGTGIPVPDTGQDQGTTGGESGGATDPGTQLNQQNQQNGLNSRGGGTDTTGQ